MVDHLTRVTAAADSPRGAALAEALAALGFSVTHDRGRLLADSTTVGGREAKELLRARGFADSEYQVFVEYVRQWGIM